MKIICVTGTPGTGKTTFAKRLAKTKGYSYLDVNALIAKSKLHEGYDRNLKARIIDPKKLAKFLVNHLKGIDTLGVVVDSHLSHYLPAKNVEKCYAITCDLKILRKRLKKRGYSAQKIKDNLEAEAFEACLTEAQEMGHRIIVKDTSKPAKK